ncbi:sodium:solute symporter family protein [Mesobacillus maritimus]|uniref:sodium:solute symporter family protein n=1 Tax=Mesobacillus maritimus TaxID=1643336 RepID=UPI00203CCFAD|nr:sodium:solute symporter family protein [Mesobacillus maritimus]MCM3584996.1 sodium:solute symporter family protein [Mesobacillus maritimus]
MRITETVIMIIYLLFCILLGVLSQRRISSSNQGIDEYYAAGRNIGTGMNSLAMLAALGSGGSFMAIVGTAWNLGIPFIGWMVVGSCVGFPLASILVARQLRNSKKITVSEFIEDRYKGSNFLKIAVPIIIIIGSGMYLMSQMKAGGLMTSYVTGLNYEWGLVIISIVFFLYVSMGGMLAVTWTNILQGLLLSLLTILLVVAGIINLPIGWGEFLKSATEQNAALGIAGGTVPIAGYIGAFLTWATAVCVTPHLIMRVFTASTIKSAKLSLNISMLIFGLLMASTIFVIVPYVPTLGETVLQSNPSDMWMLLIAENFFGPLLMGIIAAGVLAAVMSSTDALLLAISSSVAYDLYKGVVKPDATRTQILKVSGIATWIIGIFVMILTLNPPPFLIVLYTAAVGFMVSSFFSPIVLGIWWKRTNNIGAIAGLISGSVSFMIAFLFFDLPYNSEILIGLPISLLVTIVVSSLTEKPSKEVISRMESYHR